MKAITLKVPDVGNAPFDYAVYLAAKLYEDAVMTSGQAAQVAGLSKRSFIELMGKYDVSPFSTRTQDVVDDMIHA